MKARVVVPFVLSCLACIAIAEPPAENAVQKVTLTKRADGDSYSQASYSFRTASQDPKVNKNYVELLFNGCGLLHISPANGMSNRICDLGEGKLEDHALVPPTDAKWNSESIKPIAHHVYQEEINTEGQTMTVKFRVESVEQDKIAISWIAVKPVAGDEPNPRRGSAGRMGQCGGAHPAE